MGMIGVEKAQKEKEVLLKGLLEKPRQKREKFVQPG
jgi:hypothetical protein